MSEYLRVILFGLFVLGASGIFWASLARCGRSARDVLEDLRAELEAAQATRRGVSAGELPTALKDELVLAGIFSREEKKLYWKRVYSTALMCGLALPGIVFVLSLSLKSIIISIAFAPFIAVVGYQRARDAQKARYAERLEFDLALVLEKLVSAAHAGHELLGAIKRVIEVEEFSIKHAPYREPPALLPILRVVIELTECGMTLDTALATACKLSPSRSVRQALSSLSLATKLGGEITKPLRELSEATQLQYKELMDAKVHSLAAQSIPPVALSLAALLALTLGPILIDFKRTLGSQALMGGIQSTEDQP